MKKKLFGLSIITFLFLHCGLGPQSGGTVDTGNARIAGIIVHENGSAARRVLVHCIPAEFTPGISDKNQTRNIFTDDSGAYVFSSLDSGDYIISALDTTRLTRCISQNTRVSHDTIVLPKDTLHITGTLKIPIPDKTEFLNGFFYIPGTTIASAITSTIKTGFLILDSVPSGTLHSVNFASTSGLDRKTVRYNVLMYPGDTTFIYNLQSKFKKDIFLNTSPSGADISGTVTNFPVLIRLNGTVFNFSDAVANGDDIFFKKADNTVLSHEFERWDPASNIADIWVNVDTILGNNSVQHIIMYYGSSNIQNTNTHSAVFDTSNGFMGVWHLGEASATFNDATANKNAGTRNGSLSQIDGIVGKGLLFKDSAAYCDIGNALNPGLSSFTVSAWVKRADTNLQTIIAKSTGGNPSASYGWNVGFDLANQLHCYIASGETNWGNSAGESFTLFSSTKITDTTSWHHIAVVFDRSGNSSCKLFIDGESVVYTSEGDIKIVNQITNTSPLRIGAESDGDCPFRGSIDECVVSFRVRSSDWIKLCYMNQRKDNKLTVMK
jgi:hypothetical protein